ncbi:MAG: hypothetical protein AAF483_16420 [Planctomycetota bacterium]
MDTQFGTSGTPIENDNCLGNPKLIELNLRKSFALSERNKSDQPFASCVVSAGKIDRRVLGINFTKDDLGNSIWYHFGMSTGDFPIVPSGPSGILELLACMQRLSMGQNNLRLAVTNL